MNLRVSTKNRFWLVIRTVLILFLVMGCKVENKAWIDKMLSEMQSTWIHTETSGRGSQEELEAVVTAVAKKNFRPGMKKEKAFELLHELKNHGFKINEYRYEGTKVWPDGEFGSVWTPSTNPHADAATIRNLQIFHSRLKGRSWFSVSKMYGRERLIIEKHVAISFNIADDTSEVSNVEAKLWANSSI